MNLPSIVDSGIRDAGAPGFWLDNISENVIKMKHYVTIFGDG